MSKVTVSRMRERYAQKLLNFRITYVHHVLTYVDHHQAIYYLERKGNIVCIFSLLFILHEICVIWFIFPFSLVGLGICSCFI